MREDIKAAFVGTGLRGRMAAGALGRRLMPGEQVRIVTPCKSSAGVGVVGVTDRRLLLVSWVLGAVKAIDIPLDQITSTTPKAGVLQGKLKVTAARRTVRIKAIMNGPMRKIADEIGQAIAARSTPGGGSTSSAADELAKYGQLLKDRLISKEEFERKKNELM